MISVDRGISECYCEFVVFRIYIGTRGRHDMPSEYEDPSICPGCNFNVDTLYWAKQRHDNHRLHALWDKLEREGKVNWRGDSGTEFRVPVPESPFSRGMGLTEKERLYDLIESGGRRLHTCAQSRIPSALQFPPFVRKGFEQPPMDMDSYSATIKVVLVGMVDQSPAGRWQWVVSEEFALPLPLPLRRILGDWLQVDGWFKFVGEKASRLTGQRVTFIPRRPKVLSQNLPKETSLTVIWEEYLLPAPCVGVTLWAACARLTELQWSKRTGLKEGESSEVKEGGSEG